jgi:hypothetical protein
MSAKDNPLIKSKLGGEEPVFGQVAELRAFVRRRRLSVRAAKNAKSFLREKNQPRNTQNTRNPELKIRAQNSETPDFASQHFPGWLWF